MSLFLWWRIRSNHFYLEEGKKHLTYIENISEPEHASILTDYKVSVARFHLLFSRFLFIYFFVCFRLLQHTIHAHLLSFIHSQTLLFSFTFSPLLIIPRTFTFSGLPCAFPIRVRRTPNLFSDISSQKKPNIRFNWNLIMDIRSSVTCKTQDKSTTRYKNLSIETNYCITHTAHRACNHHVS